MAIKHYIVSHKTKNILEPLIVYTAMSSLVPRPPLNFPLYTYLGMKFLSSILVMLSEVAIIILTAWYAQYPTNLSCFFFLLKLQVIVL